MIGIFAAHAQLYLLCIATATTLFFVLPILLVPLRWAKMMLWRIPEHTDLTVYFGRCLGAFALIVEGLMFRAGLWGTAITLVFEITSAVFLTMVLLHIHGAWRRIQPITETLEIGLWIVLLAANAAFYPAA